MGFKRFDPEDLVISNDGATILSLLDVKDPAARMLVDLSRQQDKEVGRLHSAENYLNQHGQELNLRKYCVQE